MSHLFHKIIAFEQELGKRHIRSCCIDDQKYIAIYDVFNKIAGISDNDVRTWTSLQEKHSELRNEHKHHTFSGTNRTTPVATVRTIFKIMSLLTGERATEFNLMAADAAYRLLHANKEFMDDFWRQYQEHPPSGYRITGAKVIRDNRQDDPTSIYLRLLKPPEYSTPELAHEKKLAMNNMKPGITFDVRERDRRYGNDNGFMAYSFPLDTRAEAQLIEDYIKNVFGKIMLFGQEYIDTERLASMWNTPFSIDSYDSYIKLGEKLFVFIVQHIRDVWPQKYQDVYGYSYMHHEDPGLSVAGSSRQHAELEQPRTMLTRELATRMGIRPTYMEQLRMLEQDQMDQIQTLERQHMEHIRTLELQHLEHIRANEQEHMEHMRALHQERVDLQRQLALVTNANVLTAATPPINEVSSNNLEASGANMGGTPTGMLPIGSTDIRTVHSTSAMRNAPVYEASTEWSALTNQSSKRGLIIGRNLLTGEEIVFDDHKAASIACGSSDAGFTRTVLNKPRQLRGYHWRNVNSRFWIPPTSYVFDPTRIDLTTFNTIVVATNGADVRHYESISTAANQLKAVQTHLSRCVNTSSAVCNGFVWTSQHVHEFGTWSGNATQTTTEDNSGANGRCKGKVIVRDLATGVETIYPSETKAAPSICPHLTVKALRANFLDKPRQIKGKHVRSATASVRWVPPSILKFDNTTYEARTDGYIISTDADGNNAVMYESVVAAVKLTGLATWAITQYMDTGKVCQGRIWRKAENTECGTFVPL